jgi:hypothetical protein
VKLVYFELFDPLRLISPLIICMHTPSVLEYTASVPKNNCILRTVDTNQGEGEITKMPLQLAWLIPSNLPSRRFLPTTLPAGPLSTSSVPLLAAGEALGPSPPPSSTSSSPHPPDLPRPDLLELLAHVPGVTSLLRPAMAASRRGDLLRSWRPRPPSPPHPNASLPPLSGFARSPTRRPPAPNHGRGGDHFSQPWPRPPRPPSHPSSSSAAGGPRRLLSFPTFSPLISASGGLPAHRTASRAAAAMAEDLARGGARRGWWPLFRSSSSLSCPTAAPPRRPHGRELRRRREQVC